MQLLQVAKFIILSSSTTVAEVISEAVSQPNTSTNFHQLKAFKGMMDFVVKDVTVNEALAGTRTEPHPKLDQFVGLFQAFKTSIKDEAASSQQNSTHQALTVVDIHQLPNFAKNKGKRTKETTPTIPHCISHKDFRDSMQRKLDKKNEEEKAKLGKQAKREQVKKEKEEQTALNAKKRGKSPTENGDEKEKERKDGTAKDFERERSTKGVRQ